MGRNLEEAMAALPAARRRKIEARTAELVAEVEGLRTLRRLAGRSQQQIAASLGIKQTSVQRSSARPIFISRRCAASSRRPGARSSCGWSCRARGWCG